MTAGKNLKKLIRTRMHKTGESYTAARRHFLHSEEATMTQHTGQQQPELDLPLDHLQLTLKTARALKQHHISTVGDLAGKTDGELAAIGIARQNRIEIREVLASRGLPRGSGAR